MSQSDDDMPALLPASQLAAENSTTQSQANSPNPNNAQEQFTGVSGGNLERTASLREAAQPTRPSIQMLGSMVETANRMTTGPIPELTRDSSGQSGRNEADTRNPRPSLNSGHLPTPPPIPPFPSLDPSIPSLPQYQSNDNDEHLDRISAVLNSAVIQAAMLRAAMPGVSQSSETTGLPVTANLSNTNGLANGGGNQNNIQSDGPLLRNVDPQAQEPVRVFTNALERIADTYRRNRQPLFNYEASGWTSRSGVNGRAASLSIDPVARRRILEARLANREIINETEAELGRLILGAGTEDTLSRIIREAERPNQTGNDVPEPDPVQPPIDNNEDVYGPDDDPDSEEDHIMFSSMLDRAQVESEMKKKETRDKALNHLRYLTMLKDVDNNAEDALRLSRELALDSVLISLINEQVHDLPTLIEELPFPQLSSWLEPGMNWSGKQSGGRNRSHPSSRLGSDGIATGRLFNSRPPRPIGPVTEEVQVAALRFRTEQRQARENRVRELGIRTRYRGVVEPDTRPGVFSSIMTMKREWPVKVTINSVDWKNMSLIGTMTAINIPDGRQPTSYNTDEEKEEIVGENSMESLFTGEIIDFRIHELETVKKKKKGYTVGGTIIDVRYWAGVGPFREAILREKDIRAAKEDGPQTSNEDYLFNSPKPEHSNANKVKPQTLNLGSAEEDDVIDEVMSKCLGSAKWIRDSMSQWILMRWKEQCFLPQTSSSSSTTNPSSSTNTPHPEVRFFHEQDGSRHSMFRTDTYGLTISGYYYVALHRQSGRIEGLYYDPRSQPFQRLCMDPKDSVGVDVSGTGSQENKGGLRRDFGVFELR